MTTPDLEDLTLDDLKRLRVTIIQSRAQGVRRIEYSANGISRVCEMRSDIESRAALAMLDQLIGTLEGKPAVNVAYLRSERGWL